MLKKVLFAILIVPLLLSACSSLPFIGSKTTPSGDPANPANGAFADPAKQPVQNKLAVGILKLEGTPQAVTAEEAKTLLPLWKALKSLETNNNTAADEITALYQQIQDSLTADQVQAIEKMTWTQTDLQALMKQYGVQFAQGGNFGNLTELQRATRTAQFAQNGGAGRAGGNNGGGGFGGGGNGAFFQGGGPQGGQGGTTGQPRSTPQPGQNGGGRRGLGGLNFLLVDPVIKLLEQRAGG